MCCKHGLCKIAIAHRGPASNDHKVCTVQGGARRCFQCREIIKPNALPNAVCPGIFNHCGNAKGNALGNLVHAQISRSGRRKLISGTNDCDTRPFRDGDARDICRGSCDHRPRRQNASGLKQKRARLKIAARLAHIPAGAVARCKFYIVPITRGIFLHDATVGPGWQRRAGEDPHRLSRLDNAGIAGTCPALPHDGQRLARPGCGIDHGISVHGRYSDARRGRTGMEGCGKDAARGFSQCDLFGSQRKDLLCDQRLYIHHTKCNLKTAIDGSVWAWHQDYGTWKRDGMPEPRPTTALIMLDEPTEMNGCLYFIPGSHKEGSLEPEFNDATGYKFYVTPKEKLLEIMARSPEPVPIVGKPGTVVFFDCNILHASGHNLSRHNRWAIYVVYNPVENRCRDVPNPRPDYVRSVNTNPLMVGSDNILASTNMVQEA